MRKVSGNIWGNDMSFLPYGRQSINLSDIEAVAKALRSDYLTTGPLVDAFEAALCDFTGAPEAVVVANGTAGLHLAVLSQNLGPRDVVIVPSITFVATANAVAFCGARVVFCDVDPDTGLMTDDSFNEALAVVKALPAYHFAGVMPVHYAGRAVDLTHIKKVADAHGAFVLEDACHALGTSGPQGRIGLCAASDFTMFSFHPVKTMTTGEGGAIMLKDKALARRLRALRSHGLERNEALFTGSERGPWVYEMQALGFNYRLPDINCALGLSQLARLPHFISRRQRLVGLYQQALRAANLPVHWPEPEDGDPVFHLMAVLIDFEALGQPRAQVMVGLKAHGIGSQVHYIPVHQQPYWVSHALGQRPLVGAERFYVQTLSLPLYPDMSDADPVRVIEALTQVLK
jgi:UDP-4-amino-4,6-dideoxy-N-acetyl-beta-L-altrosamine transaminase